MSFPSKNGSPGALFQPPFIMNTTLRHIEVAVSLPVYSTYTYRVPAELAAAAVAGKRVEVPFGGQTVTGYILEEARLLPEVPTVKSLAAVLDDQPLFPPSMIPFFKWIAAYYLTPLGEVIKSALPAGLPPVTSNRIGPGRKKAIKDTIGERIDPDVPPELTADQQAIVRDAIRQMNGSFYACLLAGVTGSGKTEIYLHLAAEALRRGRTALVLVPEIALISQAERRFKARFGEQVAVLHSGLSRAERWRQWLSIRQGEIPLVIGTRSAVFAPLESPGVIIVDEEHDTSYKQESSLRYNARDLAMVRAKLSTGLVMLGSATPSVQTFYNVCTQKLAGVYYLKSRINRQPLPEITVVDLRQQDKLRAPASFISPELHRAVAETLGAGNQALLFLNRRGFASFPICAACGQAITCPNCDITLTLHKGANAYRCHFCGFSCAAVTACRTCGSTRIKRLGMGTEKIEEIMRRLFPEAAVDRLDRDTTIRKGSVVRILKRLKNRQTDILIGTQMIAKGHDFPGITLIGVICADLSLNFPDFRAGERTFQLLAQVAGRSGRGKAPGRVIMQTYNPDHFSITAAREQNFQRFYEQEIGFRRELAYPPFSRLVQIKISATDPERVRTRAQSAGGWCRELKQKNSVRYGAVEILGPVEAPLYKLAGRYRWQMLLKAPRADTINAFARDFLQEYGAKIKSGNIRLVVDVDPFMMM